MAQSATTVPAANPTPPTNFANTGATPPNATNYTKTQYANLFNMTAKASGANGSMLQGDDRPQSPYGVNPSPPPYYDDGTAAAGGVFAANASALAGGSADTAGGTGNPTGSTAGTPGTWPGVANGITPASTSNAHEGAGTETSATALGNITHTYPGGGTMDTSKTYGSGPALVKATTDAGAPVSPNQLHPSTLSPAGATTLTSIASIASGGGTGTCSATGTNFTKQSVLVVNGVSYPTTWVSATNITATTAKRPTAGTWPVYVVTGGVVQTATVNWTFT